MLTIKGKNNDDGSFDWSDALIDAGIMAGLAFFTGLGVAMGDGQLLTIEILVAAVSAGTEFFAILALKRGLRPKET